MSPLFSALTEIPWPWFQGNLVATKWSRSEDANVQPMLCCPQLKCKELKQAANAH